MKYEVHTFQVTSEPIRRRIIEILASGEHTATEISDSIQWEFGVTGAAVSHHLRILRDNDWVAVRSEWTNRLYRLDDTAIERLKDVVYYLEQLWERRIGVMARTDPLAQHTLPIESRPHARLKPGDAKGLRGKGRREDLWQRHSEPPPP